jgi:deoxycytidylate deaminase
MIVIWEASMGIDLIQVPYGLDSKNGAAQVCLKRKREAAQEFNGIGPLSCWSLVMYMDADDTPQTVLGVSRGGILYVSKTADQRRACAHGELTALWEAIDACNGVPKILEIYVEMSPCDKCREHLDGILPHGTQVNYSFDYKNDKDAWKAAANQLCK